MKLPLYLMILFASLSTPAFSEDDFYAIAVEAKNNMSKQTAMYRNEVNETITSSRQNSDLSVSNVQKAEIKKGIIQNPNTSILIFVSFSMPKQSLEAYLRDAKKIGASVIVRGLIDNSFQKTFQKMADLIQSSGGQGVELNPIWFKRFRINKVPAVIVIPEESLCFKSDQCRSNKDYDVVMGDITLSAALKMIRDRGVSQSIAQSAIDKLERRSHV